MSDDEQILIVEDDQGLSEMLSAYFREQGLLTTVASSGEDALQWLAKVTPDVVLLDIHLPGIDGYEVCRRLRNIGRCQYTPVIFLTRKQKQSDRLAGLELGAVDYITKPFDVQELGLRVRNTLKRAGMRSQASPVTGLPERTAARDQLARMVDGPEWGIVLAGIRGLHDFADVYGFVAADDVARAASVMIQKAIEVSGGCHFLGHIDAADFVIITSPDQTNQLAEQCRQRLDPAIPYFYPAAHWQALLESPEKERLTVHIARLTSADRPATTFEELRLALQSSN